MKESTSGSGLTRVLRAKDAAAILITSMVGVGILTLPGKVAAECGSLKLAFLAWVLGGAISLAGALVHAELGCRYPRAGGDYVFLREAFGPLAAFLSGWATFLLGFPAAIAAALLAAANNLHEAAGYFGEVSSASRIILALGLLVILSSVHSTGLRWGKRVQNSLVLVEISLLLFLVAGGWLFASPTAQPEGAAGQPAASMGELALVGMSIFFAYSGWNAAAYVGGEIHEPRRNLPRALAGGVILVTLLYLAVNLTYFRLVPLDEMGKSINVGGEVARQVFGQQGQQLLSLALAFVFFGTASAMIITGPRIYYAMALDGLFPRAVARVDPSSHTPGQALWLQSLWAAVILYLGTLEIMEKPFGMMVNFSIFAILPFTALTTCSVFVFRRRDRLRGQRPPFGTPGYPFTPMAFVAVVMAVLLTFPFQRPVEALIGTGLVLTGIPLYFLLTRWPGKKIPP